MEIIIHKGNLEDMESFIQLLEDVRSKMEHREWFFLDPPEFVRQAMRDGSLELWVAKDGDTLAAVFDILRPGLAEYNYGYDLDLSQEELMRVVHLDNAAVDPEYRGLGLQRRMIQCAEEQLCKEGGRILLCTVHPDNQFSLQNVLQQGYQIQKKLDKYGSVRYILRKDI